MELDGIIIPPTNSQSSSPKKQGTSRYLYCALCPDTNPNITARDELPSAVDIDGITNAFSTSYVIIYPTVLTSRRLLIIIDTVARSFVT